MPGSIPAPNSGSFMENYENIGSQMGQTDKKIKKKRYNNFFLLVFPGVVLIRGEEHLEEDG